jgi:isopentenyldiphosphate isomerase
MEYRDLYDKNRNLTGKTIKKYDKVPKGYYYTTVAVYIQNSKGDFLIQKRTTIKDGKWATTGGHPVAGENSINGLCTEIKEELGINIDKSKLVLIKTVRTKDDFFDLYYIKMDIDLNDIIMQKEEVAEVKWASYDEIMSMINKGVYKKSHAKMFYDCINYLNKDKNKQDNNEYMTIGMCLGISFGIVYGSLFNNMSLGISFGLPIGMLIGMFIDNSKNKRK